MPDTLDRHALDELLAMACGDRDFVAAVVREYVADSSATVAKLRDLSGEELRRAAHTLKSTSASVGAAQMAAICREVERLAGDGTVEPDLITAAEREHGAAVASLERHLEAL
jgi:HPt (histidine-containing phosphotransfer) domain-containing protein